jgi:ribosomal protein S18 acetylase RimI-like enzyme
MKIEKAILSDIEQLLSITKSCAKFMIENGIFQWNELYPSKEVLLNDIALTQLWKLVEDNLIIGLVVFTEIEDKEYINVQWLSKNSTSLYIHRLAVHPKFQGKGYAQKLINFGENYAISNGYKSMRLDTFSQNKRNLQFYEKQQYKRLESIYFPKQSEHPFYCYEKLLNGK